MLLTVLILGIIFGCAGFTWGVLTDGGNVFDFVPKVYYKVFGKKRPKLEKLVFSCSKCSAGQAALWGGFLFFYLKGARLWIAFDWVNYPNPPCCDHKIHLINYGLVEILAHISIIILAITTAAKLNK